MGISLKEAKANYGRKVLYESPRLPLGSEDRKVGTIKGTSSIYVMVEYPGEPELKAVPANCLSLVDEYEEYEDDDPEYHNYWGEDDDDF